MSELLTLAVGIVVISLWVAWYWSGRTKRLRCRLNLHKWAAPHTEQFPGVVPLTHQGCRYCRMERVK